MSFGTRMIGVALGCAAMSGTSFEVQAQPLQPESYVFGGELSKACAWPTVAMIHTFYPEKPEGQQYGLCTGTFVHPRVVVFASHCGDAIGVSVGLDRHAPNRITEFEKVGRNPAWKETDIQTTKFDWGYAVLKEPMEGIATIPFAYGCELDMVQKPGQEVRLVGFSDNGASTPPDPDKFVQRWAKAKISQVGGGAFIAGAAGVGVRSGDSGGPLLAQLKDGTWRTLGIISRADGSGAAVSKEMIQWFSKETGVDVVPCFDDDGKPTEGKACDALRAYSGDPTNPTADPKVNCVGAPSKWAGLACGLKKSDGSDPEEKEDSKKEDSKKEDSKKEDSKKEDSKKDDSKKEDSNNEESDEDTQKGKSDDGEPGDEESNEDTQKDKSDDGESGDEESNDGDSKQGETEGEEPKSEDPEENQEEPKQDTTSGGQEVEDTGGGCELNSNQPPFGWMLAGLFGLIGLRRSRR